MNKEEKRASIQALADGWRLSGKSQKCYAREQNISIHKLKYWLYRKKKTSRCTGGFIEIDEIGTAQGILIRYPHGVEIRLPMNITLEIIVRLVKL